MAAPIVQVPVGGPIGGRPRREGLWDTEVFRQAGTTTTYSFFKNTTTMTDGGAAKVYGFDTNLVGNGGSVPRGHYLYVFGANDILTRRETAALTAAGIDDKRKLFESGSWAFYLGSTLYLLAPTTMVPSGTGICGPVSTTENNLTAGDVQLGWQVRSNFFDLTVPTPKSPRQPIGLAETENFSVQIQYPNAATLRTNMVSSASINQQVYLTSIYVKPLAG